MKKIAVIVALSMFASFAKSQDPVFLKDDMVLNATIGFGSLLYSGVYYSAGFPPIGVSIEKGIQEDFLVDKLTLGVGGYLGFTSYKYQYTFFGGDWGYKYKNVILGGRAAVHYPLLDKLDTYTGFLLGVNIVTAKEFGANTLNYNYSASGSGLAYAWFIGGRYYVNEKLALLGELGYGIAYLNLGVAIKL